MNSIPKIKVGHVGHDHHLALFMALEKYSSPANKNRLQLKPIIGNKVYDLFDNDKKIAVLEIVRVGGGSKMPTALAQGIINVGFGGVAPVLAAIDKRAPIKLISPLHYKGDMFVLAPHVAVNNWHEFVALAKKRKKPLRIGYKNPVAVAKVIFEGALKHEGISFGSSNVSPQVQLINVKGGKNLNTSLANGIVDGYVGNNPFPAIGDDKKILKIICDLDDLPPGNFKNHPCCCIAADVATIKKNPVVVVALLRMFATATDAVNVDLRQAAETASNWIGTKQDVEMKSIQTSGYSMQPDAAWRKNMVIWIDTMKHLGVYRKHFKTMAAKDIFSAACDLSLINRALKK